MNPPLRSDARRAALLDRAADGRVDCVATDHAPHTRAEKDAPLEAVPSGVPGVETMRPLLLAAARRGAVGGVDVPTAIDTERVRDLTATGPARVLGLERKGRIAEGADADLALFADDARPIRGADGRSKCDWTPFEGWAGVEPVWTSVRGGVVYERDPDRDRSGEPVGTNAFV
jgi:dihydroorotase